MQVALVGAKSGRNFLLGHGTVAPVFPADTSAVAAGGRCCPCPACMTEPVKGGEEPACFAGGAEEAAGRMALHREKEAGRGESIALRESCRRGRVENDKGSQALTRSPVPRTSRSAPSPECLAQLGRSCRASDHRQCLLPAASSRAAGPPSLLKVTARGPCSKYKVLMGSSSVATSSIGRRALPAAAPGAQHPLAPGGLARRWCGGGGRARSVLPLLAGVGPGLHPAGCSKAARTSPVPAALSWEAAAQLLCSALPRWLGTHVERSRSPPQRAAWHFNPPSSVSAR